MRRLDFKLGSAFMAVQAILGAEGFVQRRAFVFPLDVEGERVPHAADLCVNLPEPAVVDVAAVALLVRNPFIGNVFGSEKIAVGVLRIRDERRHDMAGRAELHAFRPLGPDFERRGREGEWEKNDREKERELGAGTHQSRILALLLLKEKHYFRIGLLRAPFIEPEHLKARGIQAFGGRPNQTD